MTLITPVCMYALPAGTRRNVCSEKLKAKRADETHGHAEYKAPPGGDELKERICWLRRHTSKLMFII